MRKYLLCALVLISVSAVSCKKDKDMQKAIVTDTGDIAKDGCGYLLKLESDGRLVRPDYLPSSYQHDGYKVKIKFNSDGEGDVCNTYPTKKFIENIELTDIKRDQD